jgi:amino acid transporter
MKTSSSFLGHWKDCKEEGLGTLSGVFFPNILQMLGVILFLRLGWITGHVGLGAMLLIILFSSGLLLLTGLSMSSIVTNMPIRGGGSYYIISRSLGIELGAAIGALLSAAQILTISLCISGFVLSLNLWFPTVPANLTKTLTLSILMLISYFSTTLAVRMQLFIFFTVLVSLFSIFTGSSANIPATMVPISTAVPLTFWAAFALFFPATTGIESGMSLSGELRNPSRSLPMGTLVSILFAFVIYSSLAIFLSMNVNKELLISYPMIVCHLTRLTPIVVLGIWSATLSSALGGVLGAPRTLQAIAKDGMLPKFLVGSATSNLPRSAMITTFVIALFLTLFTNINQLIPVLTMICLMTYTLINTIAFFESLAQNPSWRPIVKTPLWVPFAGSLGCIIAMFMFNPGISFLVLTFLFLLTLWAAQKKNKGSWNDIRYALFSFFARLTTEKLIGLQNNAKSWRPNLLAFIDPSLMQENLIDFSHSLNHSKGFLTFATTLPTSEGTNKLFQEKLNLFFQNHQISGFSHVNYDDDPLNGLKNMVDNYGLGPLKPNTLILPAEEAYLHLLPRFYRQEKNILLANLTNPPKNKKIQLWWRGRYVGNFELCLALAYLLQNSALWKRGEIHINTLVRNEEKKGKVAEAFAEYEQVLRLPNLHFNPIVDPATDFYATLAKHASDADLIFVGIRAPLEGESDEDYVRTLHDILEKTKTIPNTLLVLSGEKIPFQEFFSKI